MKVEERDVATEGAGNKEKKKRGEYELKQNKIRQVIKPNALYIKPH